MRPSVIKEMMQEALSKPLSEEGKIYYAIYRTLVETAPTHREKINYLAALKNIK